MNSNVETSNAALDSVKLGVALLLVIAGIVAFYLFGDVSRLTRVLGLLSAVIVAIAIAMQTGKGRALWGFAGDVQVEVRKVVWPTRQETTQTTLAVLFVVVVSAIILWLLDMVLGVFVRWLMG
ncbi:MAG: preprotein translocase subunit SecE [Gammaproteobacteria bacterium]